MEVQHKIHPDDIQDTQKKIDEAGESTDLLKKMYETAGMEPHKFLTKADRIEAMKNLNIDGVPVFHESLIKWLDENGFFSAPASANHHGNYAGGLFDHCYQVGLELADLTNKLGLQWERPISPWVVGILHDLCKIDTYEWDGTQMKFSYNDCSIIKGHGMKSLVYALNVVDLTLEEQACIIYHMGAYTPQNEWQNFNNAVHKYPNVLYTHTADMIASQIHQI